MSVPNAQRSTRRLSLLRNAGKQTGWMICTHDKNYAGEALDNENLTFVEAGLEMTSAGDNMYT